MQTLSPDQTGKNGTVRLHLLQNHRVSLNFKQNSCLSCEVCGIFRSNQCDLTVGKKPFKKVFTTIINLLLKQGVTKCLLEYFEK